MQNISIKCLKVEKTETGVLYGQFLINALRTGQGITLGNLFRRVLLGDLSGTTITAARIAGITHEFSVIEGVREDVLELLLNLKGIILKGQLSKTKFGKLKIQNPTVITASHIELPDGLEIVNPNHYIATTSTSSTLEIELKFETGIGYSLASQAFSYQNEDFLEIDAIFMPVQKVDFKIENISDSKNQVQENLTLDIWTNGSISPEEAIYETSQIIINLFSSILDQKLTKETSLVKTHNSISVIQADPNTNIAIEELQLSVRAYNCLKRAQINTVGDLLKYSPEKLQELKNFGRKSADEVFVTLKNKLGIILK
jgi:DNA-directed RNA polymerase subunit alpha